METLDTDNQATTNSHIILYIYIAYYVVICHLIHLYYISYIQKPYHAFIQHIVMANCCKSMQIAASLRKSIDIAANRSKSMQIAANRIQLNDKDSSPQMTHK